MKISKIWLDAPDPEFENEDWLQYIPIGWHEILNNLGYEIEAAFEKYDVPLEVFVIDQLKEKFGCIRLYFHLDVDESKDVVDKYYKLKDEIYAAIDKAMKETEKTCTMCGKPATLQSVGYILPYCDECAHDWADLVHRDFEDEFDRVMFTF